MRAEYSGYRVSKDTGGIECESLERDLEAYYRVSHARVLNSATSALHAALSALGIGPGDEVLVPAYSMSASASAVLHAGATPIFCDIGDDYCLDWADALRRITPRTRGVVLVHLFGHHATVPGALPNPIAVVHDAAQSPSLVPRLLPGRSQIWCYSLNQHKIVTCGEGGYALTNDARLAHRLHLVRNHGECTSDDILGWNYRLTEPEAKIARVEFADLDNRLHERRAWARDMRAMLDLPEDAGNIDWFLYPIRCKTGQRQQIADRIGGRVGYHKPIYSLPYFAKRWPAAYCPNVERIESELVVLNPEDAGL